jgi:hypothetical protein
VELKSRPFAEGATLVRTGAAGRHGRVPAHLDEDRKAASLRLERSPHGQVAHIRLTGPTFPLVLSYSWWSPSFGSGWVQCTDLEIAAHDRELVLPVSRLTDRDRVGFLALELIEPGTGNWFNLRTHRAFAVRRSWQRPAIDPGAGSPDERAG